MLSFLEATNRKAGHFDLNKSSETLFREAMKLAKELKSAQDFNPKMIRLIILISLLPEEELIRLNRSL